MSQETWQEEASTEHVRAAYVDPLQLTREFRDLQPMTPKARPDRLIQTDGPGAPRELLLHVLPKCVGRDPQVDIPVLSSHVSRQHLRIAREGFDIVVTDLSSRNGAWLNCIRVHHAALRDGDTLQVGDAIFVFYRGS